MMVAQDNDVVVRDYIKLDVNTMSESDVERINQYIEEHNVSRSLLAVMGAKALSSLSSSVSSIAIENQPIALSQKLFERPVTLSHQNASLEQS